MTRGAARRTSRLEAILAALEAADGAATPPAHRDPLHQILLENVGYLVDDARRERAFQALRDRVGLAPVAILAASPGRLHEVAALGGILPEQRVAKLRRVAEIAARDWGQGLGPLLKRPLAEARKALQRFPGIGEPGAEKILLLAGAQPLLALDSNALRVLLRLGYGDEKKSYAASYRSAQAAAAAQLAPRCAVLERALLLLRRHGQQTCRRSRPLCAACPVRAGCPSAEGGRRGARVAPA